MQAVDVSSQNASLVAAGAVVRAADGAEPNPLQATFDAIERSFAARPEVELTILMPCLDEAETLGACIDKAMGYLARSGVRGEVVVADNGSTDGSREIARARGARVAAIPRRGYGAALIGGIEAARGRYVIMGDSDDSYDFSALDPFVEALRGGAELVMGNRFRGGIDPGAMPPLHRYLGNPVLSFVGRLFFRSPIGDFHCGLRGFSREAISRLNLTAPGMEFASEMVVKATVAGLAVAEVPTTLKPDGRSRAPHLRSWRDGWRHLKLLLTFAPHWLFLYPGLALAGAGGLLGAALLPAPLALGEVTLDGASLLFAVAAVLVGAQLTAFFLLAKLHAVSEGLLPASDRFRRWQPYLGVDRFCALGAVLVALGALTTGAALWLWAQAGFGALDPSRVVRLAAVATLCLALGVQSVTTGFLWGLLGRRERAMEAPASAPGAAPLPARLAA